MEEAMKEIVTLMKKELYMDFAKVIGGPQLQRAERLEFVGSCENITVGIEIKDPDLFDQFDFGIEYEIEIRKASPVKS